MMTKDNAELIAHMRREHDRLIPRNFPDQGYDWRTPMTAMLDRVPELMNALEDAVAERDAALAKIAAIERVQSWPELEGILGTPAAILDAGSDVMAEAKAAAWREGVEAAADAEGCMWELTNPYDGSKTK